MNTPNTPNTPKPPVIPGSQNYKDLFASKLKSETFNCDSTTLGFFGNSITQPTLQVGTLDEIINILKRYGLISTEYLWTQQGSKLVGSGGFGTQSQGISVSLSSDGNTLAVGGTDDDSLVGATWIFVRSGTTWTQQGSKLVGSGAVGTAEQGISVCVRGDTLLIGGYFDDGGKGAVWFFTRSGSVWTQQGSKLVGSGAVGNARQGFSVSLSGDEQTFVTGGAFDNSQVGANWVFTRSGSTWTQQGSKLVGTGAVGNAQQGRGVSISEDGNNFVSGGPADNTTIGAAWMWVRVDGMWYQQGDKLVGTGSTGVPNFASGTSSVTINSEGNTIAMGGIGDNSSIGATWIFNLS